MTTKKKKSRAEKRAEKKPSTALAVRAKGTSNAALIRSNVELTDRVGQLETTMVRMMEVFQQAREAPPPLFALDMSVFYLRDHGVLLVAVDVVNNGSAELSLGRMSLTVSGTPVAEMGEQYLADIELDGTDWAKHNEKVPSGGATSLGWAFENAGNGIGSNATVVLKIAGRDYVEHHTVGAFEKDAPPTRREAPKLLSAPKNAEAFGKAGEAFDAGKPAAPELAQSVWRTGGRVD